MGLLSASMLTELSKSNPVLRRAVSFAFPDVTKRYSSVPLCSATLGMHEPLVSKWGTITHSVSDKRNALVVPQWSGLNIIDVDKDWTTRGAKYDLRGTVATLLYASPNVVPGSWLTRFAGILLDWEFLEEGLVGVTCGPSDRALPAPCQKLRITRQDFPNLLKANENLFVPIGPYGRHDSFGLGDIDGQIEPVYVDTVGFRYLISLGRIKRILHAYSNGARITNTALWALVYETVNGHTYSLIDFTTDRSAQTITLDVEGYESTGDGTGTLLDGAAHQIKNFLDNFVFGSYVTGNWVSSGVLDSAHVATSVTYLSGRIPTGYKGSRYIPASETPALGIDELNAWCASMQMSAFWTSAGLLAILPDNLDGTAYQDSPWIRRQYDELISGPMMPRLDSQDCVKRMQIEGAYSSALGQYQERLEVISQETTLEAADSLSGAWLPSYI